MNFFTLDLLVQLVSGLVASVAFAAVFRVGQRHLIFAGIAGMLTYLIYYTVVFFSANLFAAAFISTTFAALYAELYARIGRAPTSVILSPAVIPTVPGGDLYYAMQHLLSSDGDMALVYLGRTLSVGLGIAGGVVIISIAFRMMVDAIARANKKI